MGHLHNNLSYHLEEYLEAREVQIEMDYVMPLAHERYYEYVI